MNELKERQRFERLLKEYKPSLAGLTLLKELKLVLLSGPTASGRNTIISRLLKDDNYRYIVSDTTRAPRINNGLKEENGITYWFRSESEVLRELQNGEYLEAEIIHNQQVSGISLRELARTHRARKIAITDIEIGGFNRVMSLKPDTIGILLLPPSFNEWQKRLIERGKMTQDEFINRLQTAARIFAQAANNPRVQIVVNDRLERAASEVDRLAHGAKPAAMSSKLRLAQSLLEQTESYLGERFSIKKPS